MPELPEVETVRQTLKTLILGERIQQVIVRYAPMIENVTVEAFQQSLIAQTFRDILRYGKYLLFILDDVSIIAHLRMEGKYFIKDSTAPFEKHEHIIFQLASGRDLRYHDTRKFGTLALLYTTNYQEIMSYKALAHLGKEANDETWSAEKLYQILHHKKKPIKSALLDQENIAGLGNIYVDEVCFLSHLHPELLCTKLSIDDCEHIIQNAHSVLTHAVTLGGTTIRSYTNSLGVTGLFQLELKIHTKVGFPCPNCQTIIKKIKVGGRGTYICPACQILQKPKVVGITGGIATGKSTVVKHLVELGYSIIDSDQIVKDLLKPKTSVWQKIVNTFGDQYLLQNKEINRDMLGKTIFSDKTANDALNTIVHPSVKAVIKKRIDQVTSDIVFVDVPLLYEASFDDLCDCVILVDCNRDMQLQRLMIRDQIAEAYALQKMASQMDMAQKRQKAQYIIDNSSDLCYTYKQLDQIIIQIKGV